MNARKALHILMVLFFLGAFFTINVRSSTLPASDLAQALRQETDGNVRISYHSETGKVRFIGTDLAHPMAQPSALAKEATPEAAARNYLATYGSLFGLADPAQELSVMRTRTADAGSSMVRFQQAYQGIPVLGGELIVNMDAARNVLSANGEVLPDIKVDTVPVVEMETARQIALEKVAKDNNLGVDDLVATQPELWIYNPMLLGGTGPKITSLVWRMDVQAKELLPIRELVLVDAQLGFVTLHFNQIDTAKNRTIYDNNNVPSEDLSLNPAVCTEGSCAPGSNDYNFAYNFAGDTYDFYLNNHSRDSLNGAGMGLISTVRYCPLSGGGCPFQNAFWNGEQMVYGQGFASADDIVGHEMTHGVTDHESRLFYYRQSGAINESFSDIWGEFIDQSNSYTGTGGPTPWLIGEDLTGFGAARSMSDPTFFGDPDRMGSANYYCFSDDNGGVHYNSGVGNKAAYLMAAGDSFNGYDVAALGITKTAKIFYKVQTDLFTSASDYQDLYDGLQQACTSLIGTAGITAADCQEVKDAVDATQMNQQPALCATSHAPVCPEGQKANTLFFDNLEHIASSNWSTGAVSGSANEWYYPQNSHSYLGFDATYATSGSYNFWGYDLDPTANFSDYAIRMIYDVALPPGSTPYLHYEHAYAFEGGGWDGGVLEYSLNGGATWNDAGGLPAVNGYTGAIQAGFNPLGGRQGFVNESNGYISTRLTLSTLAGNNVRFRFRIGTDSSVDNFGWFIDDIHIYTCAAVGPHQNVYLPLTWRR